MAELTASYQMRHQLGTGQLLVFLLAMRVLAGALENHGVPNASQASAMCLTAALAIHFAQSWRIMRPTLPLVIGLILWIVAAAISMSAAPLADPVKAWSLMVLLTLYALLANAFWSSLSGQHGLKLLDRFLLFFLAISIGLAMAQVSLRTGFVDPGKPDVMRVFGADVHPVSFGLQMVLALSAWCVVRIKLGLRFHLGAGLIAALALCAIYLTYARTAWGLLLVILCVVTLAREGLHKRVVLVTLVMAGAFIAVMNSTRFEDLASIPDFLQTFSFASPVFDHRTVDNSFSWRMVNWAFGLQHSLDAVWTGHGPGQSAAASLFGLEMHNILLEALFELGLPGLLAVCTVIAGLWRLHRRLPCATDEDRFGRSVANGAGLGMLGAVLISTSLVDQLVTVVTYLMLLRAASIPSREVVLPRSGARDSLSGYPRPVGKDFHGRDTNIIYNRRGPAGHGAASGARPAKSGHGSGYGLGHVRARQSVRDRAPSGHAAGTPDSQEGSSGGMAVPRNRLY